MPDMLDLATADLVHCPDVRTWPATADITQVSFDGSVTRINFTKKDGPGRWPDVRPPDWDGDLQYTIWLFLKIGGKWVGSAFVQMWYGRDGSGSPADPDVPSLYHKNWFYDQRWAPMPDHGQIVQGEMIGMMVTSGNARDSVGPYGPSQRSNVVTFPASNLNTFNFGSTPVPPDPPVPVPQPPTKPFEEDKAVDFGLGINAANDDYKRLHDGANIPYDPGMIAVMAQRAGYDYYRTDHPLSWPESKQKHLNEYRDEYHLPHI